MRQFNLKRFWSDKRGNIAVTFALMSVPLFGAAGMAVDYTRLSWIKSDLQEAVEAGAVASAASRNRLNGKPVGDEERHRAASSFFDSNARMNVARGDNLLVNVDLDYNKSTVSASYSFPTLIGGGLFPETVTVSVDATAILDKKPACILVTEERAEDAVVLQGSSSISTGECIVQVNSVSQRAARAQGNPKMANSEFCLAGGHTGKRWEVSTTRVRCPVLQDLFESVAVPSYSDCDQDKKFSVKKRGLNRVREGVYCGGLSFAANTRAELDSGVYHIVDGALEIGSGAEISGKDVVFVLHGDTSRFDIHSHATIDLTPAESGSLKGFLIYQVPEANPQEPNRIRAGGEIDLAGTIYAPNSDFEVHGSPTVNLVTGGNALVVKTLFLRGSPELNVSISDDPALETELGFAGLFDKIRVIK